VAAIRDNSVVLPDGRRLAYTEWGVPDGKPVLYCHGAPGSRLWCPDEKATAAAGVRLIIPDRPGIGRSDPLERRGYGDWPADVVTLADTLGLDTIGLIGVSAGGPYAAACAALRPDRLNGVAFVCSGPLTKYYWEGLPTVLEQWSAADREVFALVPRDPHRAANVAVEMFRRELEPEDAYITSIHDGLKAAEGDRWFYEDSERLVTFEAHLREWWRQIPDGLRWELLDAFYPWGFQLQDITMPVSVWHGAQDPWVSADDIAFQRAAIPSASVVIWDDSGHLGFVKHFDQILAAVTSSPPVS
jgi:pimeloyl-ACP methyl ester carboxylesterase